MGSLVQSIPAVSQTGRPFPTQQRKAAQPSVVKEKRRALLRARWESLRRLGSAVLARCGGQLHLSRFPSGLYTPTIQLTLYSRFSPLEIKGIACRRQCIASAGIFDLVIERSSFNQCSRCPVFYRGRHTSRRSRRIAQSNSAAKSVGGSISAEVSEILRVNASTYSALSKLSRVDNNRGMRPDCLATLRGTPT